MVPRAQSPQREQLEAQWNLWRAAEQGDAKRLVEALLRGAHVDKVDHNGYTALHKAAQQNHPHIVALLLKAGAQTDKGDKDGWTSLHWAGTHQGWLSTSSEDVESDHRQAVVPFRRRPSGNPKRLNRLSTISTLLEAGANVNATDKYGSTPLLVALLNAGDSIGINRLIKGGADVTARNNDGEGSLECLQQSSKHNNETSNIIAEKIKERFVIVLHGQRLQDCLLSVVNRDCFALVVATLVKEDLKVLKHM